MKLLHANMLLAGVLFMSAPSFAADKKEDVKLEVHPECNLSGVADSKFGLKGCKGAPTDKKTYTNGLFTSSYVINGDRNCTKDAKSAGYCGAKSDAGSMAVAPINAFGHCRWVDNYTDKSIFIPFGGNFPSTGQDDWVHFIKNHPPSTGEKNGIVLTHCAFPSFDPSATALIKPYEDRPYAGCEYISQPVPVKVWGRTCAPLTSAEEGMGVDGAAARGYSLQMSAKATPDTSGGGGMTAKGNSNWGVVELDNDPCKSLYPQVPFGGMGSLWSMRVGSQIKPMPSSPYCKSADGKKIAPCTCHCSSAGDVAHCEQEDDGTIPGTVISSYLQWRAGDSEPDCVGDRSVDCKQVLDKFSWDPKNRYSPDISLFLTKNGVTGPVIPAMVEELMNGSISLSWNIGTDDAGYYPESCSLSTSLSPTSISVDFTRSKTHSTPLKLSSDQVVALLEAGTTSIVYSLVCNGYQIESRFGDATVVRDRLASTASAIIKIGACGPGAFQVLQTVPSVGTMCGGNSVVGEISETETTWNWTCTVPGSTNPTESSKCYATKVVSSEPDSSYPWTECIPTGQDEPIGQTHCPTETCFLQISGGNMQDVVDASLFWPPGFLDNVFWPNYYDGYLISDIVGKGDYAETSPFKKYEGFGDSKNPAGYSEARYPFLYADAKTFDSIAIGPKTRVEIFKGENFTGEKWLDAHGPKILYNFNQFPPYCGGTDSSAPECIPEEGINYLLNEEWPYAPEFPVSTREMSTTNMQEWGRGSSVRVTCDP